MFADYNQQPGRDLYEYDALPHSRCIRLLQILPGNENVCCLLQVFDLQSSPPYDALSYTWGDPRPPLLQSIAPAQYRRHHSIVCNGRALSVTQNLYDALIQLRSTKHTPTIRPLESWIWIDAICINQGDLAERGAQVAMMADIYQRASTVVVWLGKEDRYTKPAVDLIHYLSSIPKEDYSRLSTLRPKEYGIPNENWEALTAFFGRAWFRRAWVVQEVVLASHLLILCGTMQMAWETLSRCSEFIVETFIWRYLKFEMSRFESVEVRTTRGTIRSASIGTISHLDALRRNLNSTPPWQIMFLGRGFEATDPRDHVFGFIGLMRQAQKAIGSTENDLPAPDYSKSVESVFTELAAFILRETKNLLLLSTVEDRSKRNPNLSRLPSWVPDMTVAIQPLSLFVDSPSQGETIWDPAKEGMNATTIALPIDGGILLLRGAYFDTVVDVSAPLHELDADFNWADILDFTRPLWRLNDVSGTTFGDALWRTLIADVEEPSRRHPAEDSVGDAFSDMLSSRLGLLDFAAMDPSPVKEYAAVNMKLLRGVWDQLRNDPTAFWTGPADAGQAAVSQIARMHEAEINHIRKRIGRREENRNIKNRMYAQLAELSSIDSRVFPTPEKVHHDLGIYFRPSTPENMAMQSRIATYLTRMRSITGTRRLFRTARNYLGIGAMSAKEGDQVWILPAQNVPFILRPLERERLSLVGEAYVHGIMHGEAIASGQSSFEDIELV